jgi:hypothetical protein
MIFEDCGDIHQLFFCSQFTPDSFFQIAKQFGDGISLWPVFASACISLFNVLVPKRRFKILSCMLPIVVKGLPPCVRKYHSNNPGWRCKQLVV